ncbi:Cilia/flagella-associated protein 20/WDR90/C3orf67 [Chytriomyces sp. MP71]|nr:Cilia/flagella-associated protein 20/WDR90/C3orf67 [Chytriomyces sp. MP71]
MPVIPCRWLQCEGLSDNNSTRAFKSMFKSAFQGGPSFEVFSCQGSSSSAILNWRIQNKQFVRKEYEKDVKGYCYSCEKSGKLSFPKDDKQSAYLIQPYLILQTFVSVGQHMSLEICVSDLNQTKRRFFTSTAAREIKNTALHVTLPIGFMKRGVWLNLCFDLLSLVRRYFFVLDLT